MTWRSRTLTSLYSAVTLWLAFCTVQTWGDVPRWTSITMAATSITPIVAALREAEHTVNMHLLQVQLERATRPPAEPRIVFTEAQQQLLNRLDQDLKDIA